MNSPPPAIDSAQVSLRKETNVSDEDLKAELERLRNENAALKKGASSSIRLKVSEKGAVSIYGMGRFPERLPFQLTSQLHSPARRGTPFLQSLRKTNLDQIRAPAATSFRCVFRSSIPSTAFAPPFNKLPTYSFVLD